MHWLLPGWMSRPDSIWFAMGFESAVVQTVRHVLVAEGVERQIGADREVLRGIEEGDSSLMSPVGGVWVSMVTGF